MGFTLYQLYWYFMLYAFIGWCVEVVFCTVTTGEWVNRGFLNGPVCPIYGVGMCVLLLVLAPLRHSLGALFVGTVLLTTLLELVVGWALKKFFHTSWWDYSDIPFNVGGYICPLFSLLWGLGGVFVLRVVHPPIARLVDWVPPLAGQILGALLGAVFVADLIITLITLLGFRRNIRELTTIATALRQSSDALSKGLSDASLPTNRLLNEQKAEWDEKLPELQARYDILRAEMLDTRLHGLHGARRLMRAFPRLTSLHHSEVLGDLRKALQEKGKK